jgi:glycosyltransferase involved in cell wall biosynthesis
MTYTSHKNLISIVFSFRNEEQNLPELLDRITKMFNNNLSSNYSLELIFVNDLSNDNSLNYLIVKSKELPIKILNMSRRFGVGPCVIAGLEYSKGDVVIYMDSDLQDPPELIPDLVQKFESGFDVIHTQRTKRLGESTFKMGVTSLAYRVINRFADIELPINAGDFKLLSRRAVNEVLRMKEKDPYIRGLSVWVGFKQTIIQYIRQPRHSGKTQFKLFSKGPLFEFVRGVTSFSTVILFASLLAGFIGLTISFGLILYITIAKSNGLVTSGITTIILTVSTLSSLILISNGILSIYVAKLFEQTKNRPLYVVESIHTND